MTNGDNNAQRDQEACPRSYNKLCAWIHTQASGIQVPTFSPHTTHPLGQAQCQLPGPTHAAASSSPCLLVSRLSSSVNFPGTKVRFRISPLSMKFTACRDYIFPMGLSSHPMEASSFCNSPISQSLGVSCTKQVLRCVCTLVG